MFTTLALLWKLVVCLASNYHTLVSNVFYYSGGFMEHWPFSVLAGVVVAVFLLFSVYVLVGVPLFLFYSIRYLFYVHPALLFITVYQVGSILFSVHMGAPISVDEAAKGFMQSSTATNPSLSTSPLQEGAVVGEMKTYQLSLWIYPVFVVGWCIASYFGL